MGELEKYCQNCALLTMSDSSPTQMRCGAKYYAKPPSHRVAEKMSSYKVVQPTHSCVKWQQHSPSVLRDKFH